METKYDFIDKKQKLAKLIEKYLENKQNEPELLKYIQELKKDDNFKNKQLFTNIFEEITKYLPELSNKELKQRILMINGFID